MRSRIWIFAAILLISLILSVWTVSAQSLPSGYAPVADNEYLSLFINSKTAEFAVMDKATGTYWFSNPPDRKKVEKVARGSSKEALGAQLSITYFTPEGRQRTMDSYNQSVVYEQFEVIEITNGVRVEYVLGKMWNDLDCLPVIVDQDWFEERVLSGITKKKDRELILDCYELIEIIPAGDSYEHVDLPGVDVGQLFRGHVLISGTWRELMQERAELDPEEHASKLQRLDKEILKERQGTIQLILDQVVANRADISMRRDVKPADVSPLLPSSLYVLKTGLSAWDQEDMVVIFRELGLTPEDRRSCPIEGKVIHQPTGNIEIFRVPVEYTLDRDNLVVRIPADEVRYPVDVTNAEGLVVSYPLYSISLLSMFGAAGPDAEGYLFVPDGSGALIKLNNGKLLASAYSGEVYGKDRARMPEEESPIVDSRVYLPVFGIKTDEGGLFGIIEQGDALARVWADIAGRTNSYNTVYPEFTLNVRAEVELRGSAYAWQREVMNVFPQRPYQGPIAVRYAFFGGPEAGYVAFAKCYQDYLVRTGSLRRQELVEETVPVFLDLVGGIHAKEPILGIPRDVVRPLTRFREAEEIVRTLADHGVGDMLVRYSGWLRGGKYHAYPAGARIEPALGSRDELVRLNRTLGDMGIRLFPAVDFLNVYRNSLFDSFTARSDASRFLDRRAAYVNSYNLVTGLRRERIEHHVLSPARLNEIVGEFLSGYSPYGIQGLALGDLGMFLDSDFRRGEDRMVDRQQALSIHREQMSRLNADVGLDLLLEAPNAYALSEASAILGLPMTSARWNIIDQSVPFYQMVIRGFIPYSGPPANYAYDCRDHVLRSLETGSYPCFQWIYSDSSAVKETDFADLYTASYRVWLQPALRFYEEAQAVLGQLAGQSITDHRRISEDLAMTRFEGGATLLVNYGETEAEVDGVCVAPRSYELIEVEW